MVQMIGKAVQDSIYLEGYISNPDPIGWFAPRNYDVDTPLMGMLGQDGQIRVWFEPISDEL